jgi:hypothetical protein
VVDKITWQKAGRVTEPGRYMFTFGWLTVTAEDLRVWERFPDAAFTLVRLPQANSEASPGGGSQDGAKQDSAKNDIVADEFHLGAFEIPLDNTPDPTRNPLGEA